MNSEARSCTGSLAVHPRSRDIKIANFSITFYGSELLQDTLLELNCGRRYGLVGLNGCGMYLFFYYEILHLYLLFTIWKVLLTLEKYYHSCLCTCVQDAWCFYKSNIVIINTEYMYQAHIIIKIYYEGFHALVVVPVFIAKCWIRREPSAQRTCGLFIETSLKLYYC